MNLGDIQFNSYHPARVGIFHIGEFCFFDLILLYFIATCRHLGFVDATCKLIFIIADLSNSEIGVLTPACYQSLYNFCVVLYIHSSSVFTSQLAFVDSANSQIM